MCRSSSGTGIWNRSRNAVQRGVAELLGLMGDHLALASRAHAVALDRLGEDHRRLALVVDRGLVGRIDLDRVVAAPGQRPDLRVGPVRDHRRGFRIAAEEVLADVGAVLRLEVLVFAVDAFLHQLAQLAFRIPGEELVPAGTPQALDDVPAGAAEVGLELLDDLAVAAHRAVEPLQVAVDDEDEVVEPLASGERDRAEQLRLVHLAVAAEHPDLARLRVGEAAAMQVAQEARLIDRHQRPEAHRNRGKLPEVGHQPGMRIGRQALAAHLLAEVQKLVFRQTPFEEGASVNARRAVALEIDEVAAVLVAGGVPEMHEAGVVERRRRLEARDMAAELRGFLVRLDHDRGGVPAHVAPDMLLERAVAGMDRLRLGGNGVDIGGVGGERQPRAFPPRGGDDGIEDVVDPAEALKSFDGIKGVKPLVGLVVQRLDSVVHRAGPPMRLDESRCANLSHSLLTRPGKWQSTEPRLQGCGFRMGSAG